MSQSPREKHPDNVLLHNQQFSPGPSNVGEFLEPFIPSIEIEGKPILPYFWEVDGGEDCLGIFGIRI
jgi:hypothetical protein